MSPALRACSRRALSLLTGTAVLTTGPCAHATEGERECSVNIGMGVADGSKGVGAVHGQWMLHATDFWSFGGTVRAHTATEAFDPRGAATVDARLTVDALTLIPSLALGVGPAAPILGPARPGVALLVHAEASLAWRSAREHGWVLRLAAEQDLRPGDDPLRTPRWLISVGYVNWHGKGIGLDL